MTENPPNPKQRFGDLKPNVALVPGCVDIYMALALENGADKYGPFNWRDKRVEAMTYVSATIRHLKSWVDGEEFSTDTVAAGKPVHHLGHGLASLGILVDALEAGCLIDNRPKAGSTPALIDEIAERRKAAAKPVEAEPQQLDLCSCSEGECYGGAVSGVFCKKPGGMTRLTAAELRTGIRPYVKD